MTAEIVCLETVRKAKALPATVPNLIGQKQPIEARRGMAASIKRDAGRWADHRNEPRHNVQGTCLPFVSLNGKSARLENVSRNGLMVQSAVEAGLGSSIVVAIAGCPPLSARLIWKRGDMIGLEAPLGRTSLA